MKKSRILVSAVLAMVMISCGKGPVREPEEEIPAESEITLSMPVPAKEIAKVTLTDTQQGYVKAGNTFAFRSFAQLYKEEPASMVYSPLSLQYALSMAANGASGETLEEILGALGIGSDGLEALNNFNKTLLDELPAVDLNVSINLADAILVHNQYTLQKSFRELLAERYYAPAEYLDFSNIERLCARINDWASRNTHGLINPFLSPEEAENINVAALLNALYFKAKWAGEGMFDPEVTMKNADFYRVDGSKGKVDMMRHSGFEYYAKHDGFQLLELPYSNSKFAMYVLLPDEKDGLDQLVAGLPGLSWTDLKTSVKRDYMVHVRFPKFESKSSFDLIRTLKALGIKRAFDDRLAQFDRMLEEKESGFCIVSALQKSKISVTEWGTEAAAVTMMGYGETAGPGPGPEYKEVNFFADHPFVWIIAEKTSGTILFEGVYKDE